MKNDNKLLDAIIDLGVGMKDLREEMKGIRDEMKGMRTEQQETNRRLDNLEKEQHKTNILLAEHSRSIIKLAEKINIVIDHEKRISKLEQLVLK